MKKYIWRIVGVIAVLYLTAVAARMVYFYNLTRTDEQVAKINATHLTLDDVMGKDLPALFAEASTSQAEFDATVQGLDINKNGIRDDVELAVFKEYPNSAKTRAVLLQYALALQMEVTQPIVNTETVTAVAEKTSAGYLCISSLTSRTDMGKFIRVGDELRNFVEKQQLNTSSRKNSETEFYKYLKGGDVSGGKCDLDLSVLPN